ncbi:MAG TPA: HDIG domain-containing protein [Candidatus Limnocylindrales bacterium]|nr:HDIG domain-containing protein [Candidatus Limnocylindrales bacterium]
MLAQRYLRLSAFSRRDAVRFALPLAALVLVTTAILGADIVPQRVALGIGDVATSDIVAPRATEFDSTIQTDQARQAARAAIPPQYDYTTAKGAAVANQQAGAFNVRVAAVDSAFDADLRPRERRSVLATAIDDLDAARRDTLLALTAERWKAVRDEAARVLDQVERAELKDTGQVADVRAGLAERMAGDLDADERSLATALISPLIVANSSFSAELTQQAMDRAAEAVQPVHVRIAQGQAIVHAGDQVTALDVEKIEQLGLDAPSLDVYRLGGWFVLGAVVVGLLLGWLWRFRPRLWHRNNVLLLVGLLFVLATFALKLTADRPGLAFVVPAAAVPILVAILLDSGVAVVLTALLAIVAGTVNSSSVEMASYVLLGGLAGTIAIRRGDRIHNFVEAAMAVAIVNALVVTTFSLLGERDVRGVLELWAASGASGIGAAVAAVGSFAVLGNIFGITTVFQLLELANPSQPLLRRLLLETPGTYHHSLMVGNLAERAAESIGADPLLARVAAYYHDIGKLANPAAFIENQAGQENVHEQLTPEESADLLRSHIPAGIDIAYAEHLPKSLIAFIPQHHGTALMSFFHAKAREEAAAPFGGLGTAAGQAAADGVDKRRFRHIGPKPQSREAAIIMLADGVEASVRSLSSRDEPAIRAMVARIIEERLSDGQFDECDLTLRDIERIRESFVAQLLGMYHQRIEYPQNKIVELESRRVAGGGAGG